MIRIPLLNLRHGAPEDLLFAAELLNDSGAFKDTKEMLYFFEKSWKWAAEIEKLYNDLPMGHEWKGAQVVLR